MLKRNPNDLTALKQIASIDRNINKLDQAKADELKVIAIAPNEPEAYYIVGFVDWKQAYNNAVTILAADGLTDDGEGNKKMTKGACAKIQAANTALVNEGHQVPAKGRRPESELRRRDAVSATDLPAQGRSGLRATTRRARLTWRRSDQWTQRAMGARKTNELKKEKKVGGGVTM